MADYSTIKTQFLGDRLKETRWEDREYVQQLMAIERIIYQGGPKNGASKVLFDRLAKRYPVELGAMALELRRGELTSPEEFRLLKEAQGIVWRKQEQMEQQRAEQVERRKRDRLDKELGEWLRFGGLE
ncbi:hypothetical protein ACFLUT_00410 [Chloroflexota bacterium]